MHCRVGRPRAEPPAKNWRSYAGGHKSSTARGSTPCLARPQRRTAPRTDAPARGSSSPSLGARARRRRLGSPRGGSLVVGGVRLAWARPVTAALRPHGALRLPGPATLALPPLWGPALGLGRTTLQAGRPRRPPLSPAAGHHPWSGRASESVRRAAPRYLGWGGAGGGPAGPGAPPLASSRRALAAINTGRSTSQRKLCGLRRSSCCS